MKQCSQLRMEMLIGGMAALLGLFWWGGGCADTGAVPNISAKTPGHLAIITDEMAFDRLLVEAGDRLLIVDFYADWCAPCKLLEPVLLEVKEAVKEVADLYIVDVDANRALARRMGISGIPNVVLIKNGAVMQKLRGVLPKGTYLKAIREAAQQTSP